MLVKGRRSDRKEPRLFQRALHGRSALGPTRMLLDERRRGVEFSSQSISEPCTLSSAVTVCSMLQFR